jgi:hypothetical protein
MARMKDNQPNSLMDIVKSVAIDLTGGRQESRFRHLYNNDRIAFVYDCMPSYAKTLADYQVEILGMFDSGLSRVAIRGPHGLGKTFIASILVHHGVLTAMSDCKVPTTASAVRQLEKYLWPEIRKAASNLAWAIVGRPPYEHGREMLRTSLRTRGGLVEAFAVASDNYVSIEGAHATELKYILDEAKTIPAGMWDAIEGAFSTEGLQTYQERVVVPTDLGEGDNGSDRQEEHQPVLLASADQFSVNVFAISTPGPPVGRFYDIHMRKAGYEDWHVRHVTLEEAIRAGRVSPAWAAARKRQWGEDSAVYLNRVLGEFADNTESGIVPLSWVRAAIERWHTWDKNGRPAQNGRLVLGVDVARYGDDSTVMSRRQGSVLEAMFEFQKSATTTTAGNVVKLGRNGYHVNIEVDGGLGAGVYDMLIDDYTAMHSAGVASELLHPITVGGATHFRDKSGELQFADVRSAMWWNMRELLDPQYGQNIALPDIPKLIEDLVSPQWETLRRGVIKLEDKKKIRKKIGRSTDAGDATCLAFWDGGGQGGGVVF